MKNLFKSNHKGLQLHHFNCEYACVHAQQLSTIFPNLRSLWIDTLFVENNIQNCPQWFFQLENLYIRNIQPNEQELFVWSSEDEKSRPVCAFPNLSELMMSASTMPNSMPRFNAPNLKSLLYSICDNERAIGDFVWISSLTFLEHLSLVFYGKEEEIPLFTSEQVSILTRCTNLTSISILSSSSTRCPTRSIALLLSCPNLLKLQHLDIYLSNCNEPRSYTVISLEEVEFAASLKTVSINIQVEELDLINLQPLKTKWRSWFDRPQHVDLQKVSRTFRSQQQEEEEEEAQSFIIERKNNSVQITSNIK